MTTSSIGRAYSKGAKAAEGYFNTDKDSQDDGLSNDPDSLLYEAYVTCLNNLAACYINQKEFLKAKEICTRVLELSPNNIKALLRASKAALALDLYEECELCLNAVLGIEPTNVAAAKEKERLKLAVKHYKRQEKAMALRTMKGSALAAKNDRHADKNESNAQHKSAETPNSKPLPLPESDMKDRKDTPDAAAAHMSSNRVAAADRRGWSVFLLLFTSVVVMLISIVIAWYLSNANAADGKGKT